MRQDSKHSGQRDPQPFGPLGQFVFELVEHLFKQKEVKHLAGGLKIRRPQRRICDDFTIGGEKSRPCSSGASLSARSSAAAAEYSIDRIRPATSRAAGALRRRSSSGRRRSPSKSMMKMSSLTISTLSRRKSPW